MIQKLMNIFKPTMTVAQAVDRDIQALRDLLKLKQRLLLGPCEVVIVTKDDRISKVCLQPAKPNEKSGVQIFDLSEHSKDDIYTHLREGYVWIYQA